MVNIPTGFINLIKEVDVDKFETVLVDLKKISDAVSKEVVKSTKFSKLDTKVYYLESKIPDSFTLVETLIYTAQMNKIWRKKLKMLMKIPHVSGLVITTILNTKIAEAEKKILDSSGLVTTTVFKSKIVEVENKISQVKKV